MKPQNMSLMGSIAFMLVLILVLPGFEVKKMEKASLAGPVESVQKDSKFVIVNGTRIAISSKTKIVDENGNSLRIESLTEKTSIAVEASQNSNGVFADKIIVKGPKRKP